MKKGGHWTGIRGEGAGQRHWLEIQEFLSRFAEVKLSAVFSVLNLP